MLFSMVVFLMVILVGAFWTYQGFFSALIMFFESLIACMIAFGFYEPLSSLWNDSTGVGIGQPIGFMALFLGSLGLMRVATDKLIRDNVSMPIVLDRAGAAVAGFFAGMIIVGSALTAIQMLPIGAPIFGFERYTTDANGLPVRHSLGVFRPDDFVCGLAKMLSNERFSGDVNFNDAKPRYIDNLYSSRAVPMSEETIFVKPSDIKVNAIWTTPQIDRPTHALDGDAMIRTFESVTPEKSGNTFLVCSVNIKKSAAGANGKNEIRFRVPQFRIVGPPPDAAGTSRRPTALYMATGLSDIYTHQKHGPAAVTGDQRKRLCAFGPTTDFVLGDTQTKIVEDGDDWRIDVAFEVPQDFKPWYLEFKRGGKVDLGARKVAEKAPPYGAQPQGAGGRQGKVAREKVAKVGQAPGGALHVANAIDERTDATDLIPIPLDKDDPAIAKWLTQGKFGGNDDAVAYIEPKPYVLEESSRVEKFWVPEDKRMVQIGADVLKQSNMYSRAIGFANRVLAQVTITDENGKQYFAVGFYVAAEIEGTWKIEIQYNPMSEVPERALKQPSHIKHSKITQAGPDNVRFGFLFVVDPGVKIVSFSPGAGKSQEINNVQAPD